MKTFIALIKKALQRTKERFFIYMSYFIFYLFIFLFFGLGIFFILESSTHVLFFVPAALFFFGALFLYVLTYFFPIIVLIDERKLTFREALEKSVLYFLGYLWFSALSGLFLFGLIPAGFLTFFMIFLLWSVWNLFAVFIYIEKGKKGLANLWTSRALVNKNFWYVIGNSIPLNVIMIVLFFIPFLFIRFINISQLNVIFYFVYFIFAYPFITSFYYELYKTLPYIHDAKVSKWWVIVSVIGWIIIGAYIFISIFYPDFIPSSDIPCVNTETIRCLPS